MPRVLVDATAVPADRGAVGRYVDGLVSALGAAGAMAAARKVADIPLDPSGAVNFQEYAFGLVYQDGYFYSALGGGVRLGGKSYSDDLSQIISGLFVLVALPIWAFLLARKLPHLQPSGT